MANLRVVRRSFATLFAGSMLLFLLLAALLNYLVDPYAVFGVPAVAGVNVIKPRPDVLLSDIKSILGSRSRPEALILGNSRAEVGFDPRHPSFAARGLRTFNAALPGSDLQYAADTFRQFSASNRIKLAVVGVDFTDFLFAAQPRQSEVEVPTEARSLTRTRFLALFSVTALIDSIRTLQLQRQNNPATLRLDGFNPMLDYRDIAADQGYPALFRQRAQESARNLERQPHNLDVGGKARSPAFSALREALQTARGNGTEMYLVIYPYHLLLQAQLEEAGLWPLVDQWKADLAAISDEARNRGTRVWLWDFACANDLTAEPIPGATDRKASMQWYWEAGHFKKELGDRVLDTIFAAANPIDGFGVEITSTNVEQRNRSCRDALTAMRERYPSLAREATELARQARAHE